MGSNRENVCYRVNIEFARFSKRFDRADSVSLDNIAGTTTLTVTQGGHLYRVNWDKVDYVDILEVGA